MVAASAIPRVLAIAGSDPSGGAGIQADLKACSALGAYGMAAVTALTAQNTVGVRGVAGVDPAFLRDQIAAVFEDVRVDAVKIGMLGTAAATHVVAECLEYYAPPRVVLDPVMVAKSGDRLIDEAAVATLRERLLPQADLVTPNLPEIAVLLAADTEPTDDDAMTAAGRQLLELGPRAVLVKGGHRADASARDWLCRVGEVTPFSSERVATHRSHGTGCTLSSAIAALWPQADGLAAAVAAAKRYLTHALAAADELAVGSGHGPVHHFAHAWRESPAAYWLG